MADITHRIGIRAPVDAVRAAVASADGVAGWWTRDTASVNGGGVLDSTFRTPTGAELGRMVFDVAEPAAGAQVRWRFREGPEEWVGTEATFDLERDGEMTVLVFGHRGWREQNGFMAHCSMKWATFLLSLRDLVETGAGRPAPEDVKIDNWN